MSEERVCLGYRSFIEAVYPYAFHGFAFVVMACGVVFPVLIALPELDLYPPISFAVIAAVCLLSLCGTAFALMMLAEHVRRSQFEERCRDCRQIAMLLLGHGNYDHEMRERNQREATLIISALNRDAEAKPCIEKAKKIAKHIVGGANGMEFGHI